MSHADICVATTWSSVSLDSLTVASLQLLCSVVSLIDSHLPQETVPAITILATSTIYESRPSGCARNPYGDFHTQIPLTPNETTLVVQNVRKWFCNCHSMTEKRTARPPGSRGFYENG